MNMYKKIINGMILSAIAIAACNCTANEDFYLTGTDEFEIECTVPIWGVENTFSEELDEIQTKTVRTESGITYWLPNDEISIFQGAAAGSKFTSQNTEPMQITQFKGTLSAFTGTSESTSSSLDFWGVYPYEEANSCDGSSITLTVHNRQTSTAGSFSQNEFPSIGTSPNLAISFYNVCGGIFFTVTKVGITKVTFKGNNDEDIAGKVKVMFGTDGKPVVESILDGKKEITVHAPTSKGFEIGARYYMSILPSTFSKGFSLTYRQKVENEKAGYDYYEGTFEYTNSVTFERSFFNGLTDRDVNLEFHKVEGDSDDDDYSFSNDDEAISSANDIVECIYPHTGEDAGDWGFKPQIHMNTHPTLDTQATGWDKDWMIQNINCGSMELEIDWRHSYNSIAKCNDFLLRADASDRISKEARNKLVGEVLAIRGFFYFSLATNYGRVPIMTATEYGDNGTGAERASYIEIWDYIIEQFQQAVSLLDWTPYCGNIDHPTKGMALAYLGDAYMWKAYRLANNQEGASQDAGLRITCYTNAAEAFKSIFDSGHYELSRSFTTNWDPGCFTYNKENIWADRIDLGEKASLWEGKRQLMLKWYTAAQSNGGWGSEFLSWEWWSSYEVGDKRREGSGVTGAVQEINPDSDRYDPQYEGWYVASNYGRHPYLQEDILQAETDGHTGHFHNNWGEPAPSIWTLKLWRTASACDKLGANSWGQNMWSTTPIYWKRLANIYLDYAECLFEINGPDDATAWALLDELRDRAFGNLEVGKGAELTAKFLPYYQKLGQSFNPKREIIEYPIPFNTEKVTVTPAKDYYTALKASKGFDSEVWKVAVNEERRKEFSSEWSLRPDMQKSNYLKDHIEHNYPKRNLSTVELTDCPWTNRTFDFDETKMEYPVPLYEIGRNPLCNF